MSEFLSASFDLSFITPGFVGGVNPQQTALLRPSSIRGALHFWLRALLPGCVRPHDAKSRLLPLEVEVFGGQSRQSSVALHCLPKKVTPWSFDGRKDSSPATRNDRGTGLEYLGYPFKLPGGKRDLGFAPESTFKLRVDMALRSTRGFDVDIEASQRAWRGFLAAMWGLSTFGGLGARSRRGFGSVSVHAQAPVSGTSAALAELWNTDLNSLKLLSTVTALESIGHWDKAMIDDLGNIRHWFNDLNGQVKRFIHHPHHPHIDPKQSGPYIIALASERSPFAALQAAGHILRDRRNRKAPDYERVKGFLQGNRMDIAPPRVSFGLPLTFRFNSLNGKRCNFTPQNSDRFASLLHLRVIKTSAGYSPLFHLLDGEQPGVKFRQSPKPDNKESNEESNEESSTTKIVVERERKQYSLKPMAPEDSAVSKFMKDLEGNAHG